MVIQVVTYSRSTSWQVQDKLNISLFNNSQADIILFPGWTFRDVNHLESFQHAISNTKSFGVFELKGLNTRNLKNLLYVVEKGHLRFASVQFFSTSSEINNNIILGETFMQSLSLQKTFIVKGKTIRIIQCGELNILRNEQGNNNKVKFRFENNDLKREFLNIVATTDIFLNPQHTQMGNQGKLSMRRKYLSQKNKGYFSNCNVDRLEELGKSIRSHYAYFNGIALKPSQNMIEKTSHFALYEYKI